MEWQDISTAPAEELVETKIDDENGERNVALLQRSGRLWFTTSGMYIYYQPTHWRRPAAELVEELAKDLERQAHALLDRAAAYRDTL